jgi:glucokinase
MPERWCLVVDLGATHARLAASTAPGRLSRRRVWPTAATSSFGETLARFLAEEQLDPSACEAAMIAAAGPVDGNAVTLTNAAWTVNGDVVSRALGGAPVVIVNDLAAVAMLLPRLEPQDSAPLWPTPPQPSTASGAPGRIAVNAGTGFGAAAAVSAGDAWAIVAGEPGHMALPDPVFGVATVEEALSGEGVARLYRARGGGGAATAAEVIARAGGGADPVASGVVDDLVRLLGRVTGDLVLATGAWGGAWLTGSVAHGLLAAGRLSLMREALEAKGAMAARMRHVPVHRLTLADPALLGLSHAVARLSR